MVAFKKRALWVPSHNKAIRVTPFLHPGHSRRLPTPAVVYLTEPHQSVSKEASRGEGSREPSCQSRSPDARPSHASGAMRRYKWNGSSPAEFACWVVPWRTMLGSRALVGIAAQFATTTIDGWTGSRSAQPVLMISSTPSSMRKSRSLKTSWNTVRHSSSVDA